jgi:hypothetical protein
MSIYDSSSTTPIVVSFNSKDRIGGSNSNFLSKPIDLGINKFDSVAVVAASIPRSFYNVPQSYRTFTLRELGVNYTVTLSAGSYSRNNLALVLSTALTSASGNGWTYVVSYPNTFLVADTFKYTFTVSGNGANQPSFIFASSMFRQLGFEENTTYAFSTNTLESANCINLAYVSRAFIKSNVCLNAQDGTLEEILNYGSFPMLSLCYYQQTSFDLNTRVYNDSNTNSWNFTLVDTFSQEIDLNNIPWSFSLVFYKRNDTHEVHKNELMITNEERIFRLGKEQDKIKQQLEMGDLTEAPPTLAQISPAYTSATSTMLQPVFEQQPYGMSETIFEETPAT